MTGQPGRSGGAREGAGSGGRREGAGRPPGAHTPQVLSPARILSPGQKWKYAERALQYADEMLDILVAIARDGETDAVRAAAAAGRPPGAHDVAVLPTFCDNNQTLFDKSQEFFL